MHAGEHLRQFCGRLFVWGAVCAKIPQTRNLLNRTLALLNRTPDLLNQNSYLLNQKAYLLNPTLDLLNRTPDSLNQNAYLLNQNAYLLNPTPDLLNMGLDLAENDARVYAHAHGRRGIRAYVHTLNYAALWCNSGGSPPLNANTIANVVAGVVSSL